MKNLLNTAKPSFIVGIGGSAGGLKAYKALLPRLPSSTGMAFVFIAHMSPSQESLLPESLLPEILSWSTNMPVIQASEAMTVEPDHASQCSGFRLCGFCSLARKNC